MGNVSWVNIMHSPFFFGPGGMGLNVVLLGVDVFFVFPISDGIGDIWAALPPSLACCVSHPSSSSWWIENSIVEGETMGMVKGLSWLERDE